MHGYRALEGTFLGGCLFSGRIAGREAARAVVWGGGVGSPTAPQALEIIGAAVFDIVRKQVPALDRSR